MKINKKNWSWSKIGRCRMLPDFKNAFPKKTYIKLRTYKYKRTCGAVVILQFQKSLTFDVCKIYLIKWNFCVYLLWATKIFFEILNRSKWILVKVLEKSTLHHVGFFIFSLSRMYFVLDPLVFKLMKPISIS